MLNARCHSTQLVLKMMRILQLCNRKARSFLRRKYQLRSIAFSWVAIWRSDQAFNVFVTHKRSNAWNITFRWIKTFISVLSLVRPAITRPRDMTKICQYHSLRCCYSSSDRRRHRLRLQRCIRRLVRRVVRSANYDSAQQSRYDMYHSAKYTCK